MNLKITSKAIITTEKITTYSGLIFIDSFDWSKYLINPALDWGICILFFCDIISFCPLKLKKIISVSVVACLLSSRTACHHERGDDICLSAIN